LEPIVIISDERLEALLAQVQKPARYVGQEWNSVVKDWGRASVRLALCYPETYEIGMSNFGLAILYDLVNRRADLLAERVYAPWVDMEAAMRAAGVPLFALESRRTLDEFDALGFSLQHELNYTNVLNMLDLAGLPLRSAERSAAHPLVIAGGSCTYNPEPLASFFDCFVLGEGEEVLLELLDAVAAWKASGGRMAPRGRHELLLRLAYIPGVYVPSRPRTRGRPRACASASCPGSPPRPRASSSPPSRSCTTAAQWRFSAAAPEAAASARRG
jgi:radical SAM superfamily enzyme YgiQ (UPF0313 family)